MVLNPLFFPTADPWAAGLLGVLTFSSAYLTRPLGSLIFGYIGDKIGRKASIAWTSGLMGIAVLSISCLPPYAAIGPAAPILFILARLSQGFSSIGEMIGAQVMLVEISEKSRLRHLISTFMVVALNAGGLTALGLGLLCLHLDPVNGWRWPFLFGAAIAIVGGIIRLTALESPAFTALQEKQRHPTRQGAMRLLQLFQWREKNYWLYFGIEATTPFAFYFVIRYCSDLLVRGGLSATQLMGHNFGVMVLYILSILGFGYLSLSRDPFTILKRRLLLGICLIPFLFTGMALFPSESCVFIVQTLLLVLLAAGPTPAQFPIVRAFPVIGRCSSIGSANALSQTMMYAVISLIIFFTDQVFGLVGIGLLFMVTALVSLLCASQFRTGEPMGTLTIRQEGGDVVVA